jgi:hypothetical protein
LIAAGNSLSNLKIFIGMMYYNPYGNYGGVFVGRYKGEPFAGEQLIYTDGDFFNDFALASDDPYPATGSNPFSIGMLFSKPGLSDSIIFLSSSNGGMSFDKRISIAGTNNQFDKVDLCYGRSSSNSEGNYFGVWEEKEDLDSLNGHIFTAHTTEGFNGPFTSPFCLDSLNPNTIKKLRNPVIACQNNTLENDSTNLTEIILCEKFNSSRNNYDIMGFSNLRSTLSNYFNTFSVTNDFNKNKQPEIVFNPFSSEFMTTYFDSTNRALPFLTHDFNLHDPDSWNIISAGYNDSANIVVPYPKMIYDPDQHTGVNCWIAERTTNKGVALFDSQSSTWTNTSSMKDEEKLVIQLFPNPCVSECTILFELKETEKVKISVYNVLGQKSEIAPAQTYLPGRHQFRFNTSTFQAGCYMYFFTAGNHSSSGKFFVAK